LAYERWSLYTAPPLKRYILEYEWWKSHRETSDKLYQDVLVAWHRLTPEEKTEATKRVK
jgi:hypothetical protein